MSPLHENRTEAVTRGYDLRKVCMWRWELVDRDAGGLKGQALGMQLCTMPPSLPAGAGHCTPISNY